MSFGLPPSYLNATKYTGDQISDVPCVMVGRAPRTTDTNYPILTLWINSNRLSVAPDAYGDLWYLAYFIPQNGLTVLAKWIKIGGGSGGPLIDLNVPLGVTTIVPDGTGTITYTSNGGTLAITGSSASPNNNFVNFDIAGGGAFVWQTITANQTLVIENGYMCISPGGNLSLALPSTSTIGDTIEVVLDGATSWTITQPNAASQIRYGNVQTTLGVGGSISSNQQGDYIRLVCQTTNGRWNAFSSSVLTVT